MKIFFYVFAVLYIYFYLTNFYFVWRKYNQFQYLLDKFRKVSNSLPEKPGPMLYHLEDDYYKKVRIIILDDLFDENPLINHLIPYNYDSFSINNDGRTTLIKFAEFYDQLQKANNNFEFLKLSYLNPLNPIKQIFLLPSKILSWFGINLNTMPGRIVSAISWLCLYLFKSNASEFLLQGWNFIKSLFS